jgi:hypothetical protein
MSHYGCALIIGGIESMNRQEFEVTLLKPPDIDGAYFIVPFNVPEVYGTKAQLKNKTPEKTGLRKLLK